MKQKVLLFLCLCLFASMNVFADYTLVDGIYYALRGGKAVVNSRDSNKYNSYTGNVVIPEYVTYNGETYHVETIGSDAFRDCEGLISVFIPNSVTLIMERAFYNCGALTSVTLSENESYIREKLFYKCRSLTSINIPNSVEQIGKNAFEGCSSLTSVNISDNVTWINDYAFCDCSSLASVTIGNNVKWIGKSAFSGCSLTSVSIGDGVETIGDYAFYYGSFISVTIPESVTKIGEYAFSSCKRLTSITIPEGVRTIGENAFQGCGELTSVTIESDAIVSVSRESDTSMKTIFGNQVQEYVIGDAIKAIGNYAFYESNIKSVIIPNSVTSIGNYAFYNCSKMKSAIIGSGVSSIGYMAFLNCCLTDLYCYAKNVPATGDFAFRLVPIESATLYVPEASIEKYKTTEPWSGFGTIEKAREREARIDGIYYNFSIFEDKAEVTYGDKRYKGIVVIPESVTNEDISYKVTSIGKRAFYDCSSMTSVTVPKSIVNIGKEAFQNTSAKIYVRNNSITLIRLWNAGYEDNVYDVSTEDKIEPFRVVSGITASSVRMNSFIEVNGAQKLSEDLSVNGEKTNSMVFLGLEPETGINAKYSVNLQYGDEIVKYEKTENVKTAALTFTSKQPKVISEGNVIVAAQSNLDDEEVNAGFEWRRTDWSDDFDSKSGSAYLYDGMMEGYIRSLNSNFLWKFRPFYTSNAGNTYYGEWKGLDPSDYSYFEPTVHTYTTINVQGNMAEVKGYVMRGTDNVTSQGFMYWSTGTASSRKKVTSVPASAMVVTAKGNVMTATLEDLEYETQYCYVAFVTTSEGETFYGELQTFSTDVDPDGLETIRNTEEVIEVARYDLNGRKLAEPQKGINIIRYSDGTTRKVLLK